MKYLSIISILFLTICCSCNLDRNRRLSEEEISELAKAYNDSVMVVLDSLYTINIYVPPLYDQLSFDSATVASYYQLAKETKGELKLLVNSKLIANEIAQTITSHAGDNTDILFLIDKTGSMQDDIKKVRKGLGQIISALKKHEHVRLGIAFYGDKNVDGNNWFLLRKFEEDYDSARKFVDEITVSDGGDYPESVYDGFFKTNEQDFWKSYSNRMIILIGDAPPLEKPLSQYSLTEVIAKATENKITMNFYPIIVTPTLGEEATSNSVEEKYMEEKLISASYPIPTAGNFNVTFYADDNYTIEIFNTSGSLILSEQISGSRWRKDMSGFENGAYIIRISTKDKKYETSRFIIQK